ncbi:hypothetical protein LMG27952_06690 [Paraburkholderia hiiakae]|uniref:Arginine/ornithine antiporter ArcD n=1 Tax=Paraburkholderia hiiakae TaxID=1081782 RepID=A0ABM8P818_9BURK|nr:hypothetical protein [Paraburkholderia hiiakae]CAD6558726.1 hypothetical protein LMG27952_06690 [Paraburkholderia hiiakae]
MEEVFGAHWGAWAAVVGSGVFHGVNPAMGWLFATALGLQRGSRTALLFALPPIALGHAASILLFTSSTAALGAHLPATALHWGLGALLIAWAAWQHAYGHRHRVRVGMTVGFVGLAAWSALMATLHGAGLMLMPAMLPLCGGAGGAAGLANPLALSFAFTALHTITTLATTAAIALLAYEYLGLGVLRRGWINFDWLWRGALVATGTLMIATA